MNNLFNRILFLITLATLFKVDSTAQQIETSSVALSGIEFKITGSAFPDTLSVVTINIENEDITETHVFALYNGLFDTTIVIPESGKYLIFFDSNESINTIVNVIPDFLSIIPPLLAIAFALLFRQVILSLLLGIYSGAIFIYDYNPLIGFFRLIDKYIINALTDVSHIQIIVFTLLFGGVVGIISKGGGTRGIANSLVKFARTRRSGMISTWVSGLIIFFDDYANTLVVGNLMRPIMDKLKISREKLSFIVDATAAPVASIFIVSSWIGYEVGLIQDGLTMIGSTANAYSIFLETIPFRFYPIAMLLFVFFISFSKRDFGPMLKAERRALETGEISSVSSVFATDFTDSKEYLGEDVKAKWYNGIIPIMVIIFGTIAGLIYTGINSLEEQGITSYAIKEVIGNSDSYLALLWGSFAACIVAIIMLTSQRILTLRKAIDAWFSGIRSMLLAVIILTLAWGIGAVTNEIKTADYIISLISESINPRFLPVIVFLVCGLTSFATGTSWGTMAIMFPIVIPLSAAVTGIYEYSIEDSSLILVGVISSVLAGCVWGDHCSPISDTTILSSMASGCDHIDHVRTQLPYAIVVGVVCMTFGDILSAFAVSPYISIFIIIALLVGIVYLFGKRANKSLEKSTSIISSS
ncbi:MAG: Na+/H+ antiporter NhaC family protein [Ignavibacteria bacterium]|nr:Na+/H+ antiporter NhaC family protein [Ignavibacteria bacterium]